MHAAPDTPLHPAPSLFVAGADARTVCALVAHMVAAAGGTGAPAAVLACAADLDGHLARQVPRALALLADAAAEASWRDRLREAEHGCAWVLPSDGALLHDVAEGLSDVLWYGLDPREPDLLQRMRRGGDACYWEDGTLFLQRGDDLEALISEATLPMARGGTDRRATACALVAAALASYLPVSADAMRDALESFPPPA